MNKPLVYGIAGLGILTLIGLSLSGESDERTPDEKVNGLPTNKRVAVRKTANTAEFVQAIRFGPSAENSTVLTLDGQVVPLAGPSQRVAYETAKNMWVIWRMRRRMLPKDASLHDVDKYSKELYWLPAWLVMGQPGLGIPDTPANAHSFEYPPPKYQGDPNKTTSSLQTMVTAVPVDEFGRLKPGHYGSGGGLWDATIGGLLQNPLFKAVLIGALVASGPYGMAAYGAYTMWNARGGELTAQNVFLTAARSYAVAQCGPACGMAFDFGVGVASGKSVDTAAEDALYESLTPEERAYFDQGKQYAKEVLS